MLHGPAADAARATDWTVTVRFEIAIAWLFGFVSVRLSGSATPGASRPERLPEMVNGLPTLEISSCTVAYAYWVVLFESFPDAKRCIVYVPSGVFVPLIICRDDELPVVEFGE